MCNSCFYEDWGLTDEDGDRLPDAVAGLACYLALLPQSRREAIERCYGLTVQHQQNADWMGSLLHAGVDNDNYDYHSGGQAARERWRADWREESGTDWNNNKLSAEDEDTVCDAWDELTWQERSLVVAWRCSYSPFQPDPAAASLPPERAGHLPTPPWDTPLAHEGVSRDR